MSIQISFSITDDDHDLRPLYERLINLPDGRGKQHRARIVRHALVTGVAALYGGAIPAQLAIASPVTLHRQGAAQASDPQRATPPHLNDFLSSAGGDDAFAGL